MSLFGNKFDIKKNFLQIKFDSNLEKYVACFRDGTVCTTLNRRSMKMLNNKNALLSEEPTLLEQEKKSFAETERFHKLKELGFICNSFEALSSSRTTDCISEEVLEYLNALTSEENILIGIHRTGFANLDKIADILKRGLVITRRGGSTTNSDINLENNVSYYSDNKKIIKELVNADCYKQSLGSILIRIPDNELLSNIFLIDVESEEFILDPKFIIGFVPVGPNGSIKEIISANPLEKDFFKGIDALYQEREYAIHTNNSQAKK